MLELKFMEPQSRWMVRLLFKRDYDGFTDPAKRRVNWGVLMWDVIAVYALLQLL